MRLQFSSFHRALNLAALGLTVGTGLGFTILPANQVFAADQVVLKYQVLQDSLSIKELVTFATTGNMSPKLAGYLKLAQANNPNEFRQALGNEIKIGATDLDQFLNSWFGKIIVDEMSQIIRPTNGQGSKQALRSAVTLAAKDNKISFLKVLQNYLTTEVEINIDRLIETDKRINAVSANPSHLLMLSQTEISPDGDSL